MLDQLMYLHIINLHMYASQTLISGSDQRQFKNRYNSMCFVLLCNDKSIGVTGSTVEGIS